MAQHGLSTNLGIAVGAGLLIWVAGLVPFLAVHLPVMIIAATAGVWLFYVQHQFEATTWDRAGDWSQPEAALHASSFYDLPEPLRWFSANIGVHQVHHLSSGIPFYRLREVLRDHPELQEVGRLTLWHSFGCVRLALWDEDKRRTRVVSRDAVRSGVGATGPSVDAVVNSVLRRERGYQPGAAARHVDEGVGGGVEGLGRGTLRDPQSPTPLRTPRP